MKTSTLILGGGFGGLATAYTLTQLLPDDHKIVLIDKSPSFNVGTAKTWVMLGDRSAEHVVRSRKKLLPRGVELIQAEVQKIDPSNGEVTTNQGTVRGDFLVIALGADLNMGSVPGLATASETFYTVDGAVRLQNILDKFAGGDVLFLILKAPFKCPPAPYEAAMMLHHSLTKRGVSAHTRLSIHTVEPDPMPTGGPEIGLFIRELLSERNIAYHPLKKTASVDSARRTIRFEDGSEARYDLLIAIPPHEAPKAVREAGFTNQSGWIPVDPQTLKATSVTTSVPVFAIGDVASVPLPGRFKPDTPLSLPKAGVMAASQGVVVANQIASLVLGKGSGASFDGKGFCYIEVGGNQAVRGDGSFFDLPHPTMNRKRPDAQQYREKLDWVDRWTNGNLKTLLDL